MKTSPKLGVKIDFSPNKIKRKVGHGIWNDVGIGKSDVASLGGDKKKSFSFIY